MIVNNEDRIQKDVVYNIESRMKSRLNKIAPFVYEILGDSSFICAGNSCNSDIPRDYDIYAVGYEFKFEGIKQACGNSGDKEVISETKNALTVRLVNGIIVQFCKYKKDTLKQLVKSFDFSTVQIGVMASCESKYSVVIEDVYFTGAWVRSQLNKECKYTGSEYPLSSLLRCAKYYKRDIFSSKMEYDIAIMYILKDIISRGFYDYDDFKDQLEAVDMNVFSGEAYEAAMELYYLLGNKTSL